jgi:hypothetical protein
VVVVADPHETALHELVEIRSRESVDAAVVPI